MSASIQPTAATLGRDDDPFQQPETLYSRNMQRSIRKAKRRHTAEHDAEEKNARGLTVAEGPRDAP